MKLHWLKLLSLSSFFFLFSAYLLYSEVNLDEGRDLFRTQCASCHNRNMVDDLTGPALGGVQERWGDWPIEDLRYFIRFSQRMIEEGHPKATELWTQWRPNIMNNFPNLTDQEIDNILAYIDGVYTGEYGAPAAVATDRLVVEEEADNTLLFISLLFILALLAVILARIASVLNSIQHAKETGSVPRSKGILDILTSKTAIGILIFAAIVMGGYTTVNNAIDIGRQQGYAPQQPIKFSHAVHSGLHQIDCQYCHDAARRSKNALIPPT